MAKILAGPLASKISGTIGGTTFGNYRGMIVARTKPVPTKTLTARQMFINSLMTLLSRAWRDELNQGLRTAWNQRAKNFPWVDIFGNERKMTGENLYIKQNMVLLDHLRPRVDSPVASVEPPELHDLHIAELADNLQIGSDGLAAGTVASQAPFLDIWIAGGFLTSAVTPGISDVTVEVETLGLPQGRKAQKSDYRHVAYADEWDLVEPVTPSNIVIQGSPADTALNISVIIRRYNKYGNFSAPLLFQGILAP